MLSTWVVGRQSCALRPRICRVWRVQTFGRLSQTVKPPNTPSQHQLSNSLLQSARRFSRAHPNQKLTFLQYLRKTVTQRCNVTRATFSNMSQKSCRKGHHIAVLLACHPTRIVAGSVLCCGLAGVGVRKAHCEEEETLSEGLLGDQEDLLGDQEVREEQELDWSLIWQFLRPEIWQLMAAIALALGSALLNIQIPLMLGNVVNVVSECMADQQQNYLQMIIPPASRLLAVYALQGVLSFGYIWLLAAVGERMAARMRIALFENLVQQDMAFFDSHMTGQLVDRLTSDVQDFKSSFKLCISQGLRSVTQVTGCFVSLYLISPKLTGLLVLVMPTIVAGGGMIGSGLRALSRAAQEQVAKGTAVANEALGNIRTVRAFAMEEKESRLYADEVNKAGRLNELLGLGIGVFQGAANFVLNGVVLGVLFSGGLLLSTNDMSAGDLMSFLAAAQMIQRSLASVSVLFGQAVRGVSAGARVLEYMQLEPTIPRTGGQKIPFHSLFGTVEFKDVSFSYPTRPDQLVLDNFNLKLPPCKVVALCGTSGAGKSTVAALLERFYDVEGGSVMLDGHDIRDMDATWLRGRVIGFIHQEPVLFATSIMENIRYGKPAATDREVYEAAKLANADGFIRDFPDGYSTVVGERGVTVSGGQKQRIAIARALLKNPSVLVLDEATSALDADSERLVQEALERVMKGRTVLIIAHRLSTIENADVIVVMSKGRVVEQGTHAELKKRGGMYADLIRRQTENGNRNMG
ncbi:mitochondrial potassium channel ATP-binding subunit-like [Branchiostoma floridae x Branchiostoma belcheri]